MSKLSCEVIKDLLPSYIDDICSKDSKELIEEHISECGDCAAFLDKMRAIEIVSDKANEKEIDYMKKVKRHIINKDLISLGLLFGFIAIGMTVVIINYGDIPTKLYYALLPILVFSSYYMLSDHAAKAVNTKWKVLASILGLGLICYSIFLEFRMIKWVEHGIYPFGMSTNQVGPFVYYQLLTITIIQIVLFIGTILVSVKSANSHGMLLDICVAGICLALAFISMLKRMDSIESFAAARNNTILILLAEGVFMAVIISILERRKSSLKYTIDES